MISTYNSATDAADAKFTETDFAREKKIKKIGQKLKSHADEIFNLLAQLREISVENYELEDSNAGASEIDLLAKKAARGEIDIDWNEVVAFNNLNY